LGATCSRGDRSTKLAAASPSRGGLSYAPDSRLMIITRSNPAHPES